jgi:hypothetical protein
MINGIVTSTAILLAILGATSVTIGMPGPAIRGRAFIGTEDAIQGIFKARR